MRTLDLNMLPDDTKLEFDTQCPYCNGEGAVKCPDCDDDSQADCSECDGTGILGCEQCVGGWFEIMSNTAFHVHLRSNKAFANLRLQAWDLGFCLIDLEDTHWLLMGMCGLDCAWVIHYTRWLLQSYLDPEDIDDLLSHHGAHVFLSVEERRALCQYVQDRIPTPDQYTESYRRHMETLATIAASEASSMTLSEQFEAHYLAHNGLRCGNSDCGSDDIRAAGQFQADDNYVWRDVRCFGCGAEWQDVYTLTGIDSLEIPQKGGKQHADDARAKGGV